MTVVDADLPVVDYQDVRDPEEAHRRLRLA
jgi:hypothetical protein